MRTRNVVLGALATGALIGFFGIGTVLYRTLIGLDASAFVLGGALQAAGEALGVEAGFSLAGLGWVVLLALLILVGSFLLVRRSVRAGVAATDPSRRSFLTGTASGAAAALGATVVAAGAAASRAFLGVGNDGHGWRPVASAMFGDDGSRTHSEWPEKWKGARVKSYRRLGRTDWKVSDIVLGTGRIQGEIGERIAREAIERGVNYFDTAPDYSGSGSEQAMGRAIKGVRDQLFIATKFCTTQGHLGPKATVAAYKEVIEASLGRLGTDYVDLIHIHSCDEVDRLMSENAHEAFDRLKQEGKARFLGFSSHTPRLVEVANRAIDSGRFDVMMLAYHFGIWNPLGKIIERAHREQDMGVVAMKTLKGAKHNGLAGFREEADAFSQAALRWALSNEDVSCAVISFFERQHVDEYLYASGGSVTDSDLAILQKYDRLIQGTYCSPACGACLSHCPVDLPIADVLRHRMYFEDYGWEKEGMRLYAALERNASTCADCAAPCLGSCPLGIDIKERMTGAHELLTLA